jgi:hypothetical protein
MSRRKQFIKAWKMATKTEVEVAITPKAIASAKQYLAQPQVMKRLVELVGGSSWDKRLMERPWLTFCAEGLWNLVK